MIISEIKKKKINILFYLFILLVLYIIYTKFLYSYITFPIKVNNQIYLFSDWSVIFSAIHCKSLGLDVFVNNPCDVHNRPHVYGNILLFIPFFKEYSNFYLFYFPLFFNLIFISIIVFHFNLKKITEIILCFLIIINPSTLLAMERFNIDILIFLILIFLCYFRSNLLNLILISTLTLAKFYPIVSSVIFFFKGNKFSKLCYFSFFLFIIFIFFYFDFDNLKKIFLNKDEYESYYQISFSIFNLKNIPLVNSTISKNYLIIFTLLLSLIFFFYSFSLSKKISFLNSFNFDNYVNRLFFLGAVITITVYFIFNNYYYREIFLFFLIPFLLKKKDQNLFIKYLLYLFILRYFLFLITNYLAPFLGNDYFLMIKVFMDIFLMSIISGIFIRICIILYSSKIAKKKIKNL